uniref:Uncharacterized protein n=1 Tax=Magallana gigas TaxID=29159 RepID=K1QMZ1_MAGGI
MTITNREPSQKSIKRNTNSKQSNTDLQIEIDQVPRRSEHPLLTGYHRRVLFVVIGKKIGKVRKQLGD